MLKLSISLVIAGVVIGCGGGSDQSPVPVPSPVTSPVTSPVPSPVPSPAQEQLKTNATNKGYGQQSGIWTPVPQATNPITADPTVTSMLTVYRIGIGSVTSDIPGIDCGEACKTAISKSSTVTLTAKAPVGYSFTEWMGDCIGRSTCVLSMKDPHIVTAVFTSVPTIDGRMECVFNWIEKTFSSDYAPASVTREQNGYLVRYYSSTRNYLALQISNLHLYYVDPNGYMYDYGGLVNYLSESGCAGSSW